MAFPSPNLTVPTLSDWQFSFNGVTMGVGTSYGITNVTGLDLPTIRNGDKGRPRDQGMFIGLDVFGGRSFTLDLWVLADGTSSTQALLEALAAATPVMGNTEIPLWFKIPNMNQMAIMCRVRKRTMPFDFDYGAGNVAKPVIQFFATDPRVYYSPSISSTTTLPNGSVGGLTFNFSFPMSFLGTMPGQLVLNNIGNYEMRPIIVFTGPLTNPSIQNTSIAGNPKLTFTNPTQINYTLQPGDTLTVDLDFHSISYTPVNTNNPQQVLSWYAQGSTWFNLGPGQNLLYFSSSDHPITDGTVTVNWASSTMI